MDKYFAADDAELMMKFGQAGGRIGTNSKIEFSVHFKHDGKPAIISPADVKATLTGPARAVAQTRGAANKYNVFWTTQTPGLYTAEVVLRGKFKATCSAHVCGATSGANTRIEGPTQTNVGTYKCITRVVDVQGTPLPFSMGDNLQVGILAVEGSFANLKSADNSDGTFTTTVDIKMAGQKFELTFKINNEDVGNSPWRFTS